MTTEEIDLPDRPGGAAPHVVVQSVEDPRLEDEDRHHLTNVRRLRDGDLVSVTDGAGSWRWCRFAGSSITIAGATHTVAQPAPTLTVGFALVKGSKPELVVQKLTELGIDVIVPFVAERSVVRWDDAKIGRQSERLTRVAREASMQSRRMWLPRVERVATFGELIQRDGVVRAERDGEPLQSQHVTVLIGPEGGWSESEAGATPIVGLGSTVLRAETAAIAAGTLMVSVRDRSTS